MEARLIRNASLCSLFAVAVLVAGGVMYLRQLSLRELGRIERLANDVKSLRVGLSTYLDAKAIAERYGTAKYENHWGTRDCAKGYYERCAYQISLKAPSMGTILRRFHLARRIGLGAWSGTAFITIENGRVEEYYFSFLFETPDRQWRGFGTEEYKSLEERAVAAHVSDSYVVSRNDIMMSESTNGQGFSLDSTLTPQATESERKHAWHYNFSCLARTSGCDEICDALPDAWRDFYVNRGQFDVQKFGNRYAFCTKSA